MAQGCFRIKITKYSQQQAESKVRSWSENVMQQPARNVDYDCHLYKWWGCLLRSTDERDLINRLFALDCIICRVFDKEAFYAQFLTRPTGWTQEKLPLNLNNQQFCFSYSFSTKQYKQTTYCIIQMALYRIWMIGFGSFGKTLCPNPLPASTSNWSLTSLLRKAEGILYSRYRFTSHHRITMI